MLQLGKRDRKNALSVGDIFHMDATLSERSPCKKTFSLLQEYKHLIADIISFASSNEGAIVLPNRFSLLDSITERANDVSSLPMEFLHIKEKIEDYFNQRNPRLLKTIRSTGTFKQKLGDLSIILEKYSYETAEHVNDVGWMSLTLAGLMSDNISIHGIHFYEAGKYHDIGKLLIRQEVLGKKGKFNDEERQEMEQHSLFSSIIVKIMLYYSIDGKDEDTRRLASEIIETALYHHRTVSGGYPMSIPSKNITVEAEIVRIVDMFQALSSPRCYKEAYDSEKVDTIIDDLERTFAHPEVFETFKVHRLRFHEIMKGGFI